MLIVIGQQIYRSPMSRHELLFKLLEKVENGDQYLYSQFCELSCTRAAPATVKRMQILQMGSCRINMCTPKLKQDPIFEKQTSFNNKRVLVMQKIKSTPKALHLNNDTPKPIAKLQEETNKSKYSSMTYQYSAKKQFENVKTEAESPLRQKTIVLSIQGSLNDNSAVARPMETVKSEKNCHMKPTEPKVDIQKYESSQNIKRKLSNTSRIKDLLDSSSCRDEEKRVKFQLRKQLHRNYQKAFAPPPKVTAKSYIVYEMLPGVELKPTIKIHGAFNSKVRMEIASLTKIMTCIVAIQICQKLGLQADVEEIKIGKFQSSIGGTTANLEMGDVYSLYDLLHGLMLPSGNDASLAIAVWGGRKLLEIKESEDCALQARKKMKKQCYDRFIREMNQKARLLEMTKTNYANSHGLINLLNRSCAHDVAILSHYCMNNFLFSKIVGCKQYHKKIKKETKITIQTKLDQPVPPPPKNSVLFENEEDKELSDIDSEVSDQEPRLQFDFPQKNTKNEKKIIISEKEVHWTNTHKLLHKNSNEYLGIKTGVTTAAGPCLSSCVLSPCGRKLFIVVLSCKQLNMRFKQTQILKKWTYKKEGITKKPKSNGSKSTKSEVDNDEKQSDDGLEDIQENPCSEFD